MHYADLAEAVQVMSLFNDGHTLTTLDLCFLTQPPPVDTVPGKNQILGFLYQLNVLLTADSLYY